MFIGHWAPALAAAAVAKREPRLGALFLAGQLVDWAFVLLVIADVEHLRFVPGMTTMNSLDLYHMPYTHSLLGAFAFAAAFGAVIWAWLRDVRYAILCELVVLSHWFLDLVVHRPDLTLVGSSPKLGFGLWNYPAIEMPLEIALIGGAFWLYLSRTRGPALPAIVLGGLLAALQAYNWFGPHPTEVDTATIVTQLAAYGIVTLAAWWLGKTRTHAHARG